MNKQNINIVWLKRDLRTQDHVALFQAEKSDIPYLLIYIFEPLLIKNENSSLRHFQFIYQSIKSINKQLESTNIKVETFYGVAENIFEFLINEFDIENVYSYQEIGIEKTWQRDIRVKSLFKKNKIRWTEYKSNGVIRGLSNRGGWDKKWFIEMSKEPIRNSYTNQNLINFSNPFPIPKKYDEELMDYSDLYQPAGEKFAWIYLNSFLEERGKNYNRFISKPELSRKSCARISPYLAWGNLSSKQVYHAVKNHKNYTSYKGAFQSMLQRLKWRDHFMQKFEMEVEYEYQCVNRGFETLSYNNDDKLLAAWKTGHTGFPLIDATMRCLINTGWVNFRMRAMLVSFLCHNLDQDWRR
jgi:deoxyribodipyrimidine photo-lyase